MIIAKKRKLEKNCISQNNDALHQCVCWKGGRGGGWVSTNGYLSISKIYIHTYEVQFNEIDYREIQQHMLCHRIKPDRKVSKYVKQQHYKVLYILSTKIKHRQYVTNT